MTNQKETWQDRFEKLLYEFADSVTDRDGNVDSVGSANFNIASKDVKEFIQSKMDSEIQLALSKQREEYEKRWNETPKYCEKCGKLDL